MANFPLRLGGGAGAPLNSLVSSAEHNSIDADHVKAANFSDGSAHVMAADVELTGPGTIKLMGTSQLEYASRAGYRNVPLVGNIGANFSYNTFRVVQIATGGLVYIPLDYLPHGQELDAVTVRWKGEALHIGADPPNITYPVMYVVYVDLDGTSNTFGPVTDTSASTAIYEAPHNITVPNIGHTINRFAYRYFVQLSGEGGVEFQAGAQLLAIYYKAFVTSQAEC